MPYTLHPDGHMTCDTVDEALAWLNAFAKKTPVIRAVSRSKQPKELRKLHRYVLALVVEFNPVVQRGITTAYGLPPTTSSLALNYLKRRGLVVDTRSGNGKSWQSERKDALKESAHV